MTWRRRFAGGAASSGRPPLWSSVLLGIAVAWLALSGSLLFWATAPSLAGWRPYVVLTNSMRPVLAPGDVVLVTRDTERRPMRPGEVALVADANRREGTRLHRYLRTEEDGRIVTKGDANRQEDMPSPASALIGRVRLVVPAIGSPVVWMRNGSYLPALLAGAGTWVTLMISFGSFAGRGRSGAPVHPAPAPQAPPFVYVRWEDR